MGWAKLTDKRAMNRKLRRAGFEARGLDEAAICQIASDETDGVISEDSVEMLAIAHRCDHVDGLVVILVKEGRWEPTDGGWIVKGYLKHNPSRADREADRERKRSAGRAGGLRSGEARAANPAKQPASETANHSASDAANSRPVPSRPVNLSRSAPKDGDPLVNDWLDVVGKPKGSRHAKDMVETHEVVAHLRRFVNDDFIADQIRAIGRSRSRPRYPSYLLKACIESAMRQGVSVPPLTLATQAAEEEAS